MEGGSLCALPRLPRWHHPACLVQGQYQDTDGKAMRRTDSHPTSYTCTHLCACACVCTRVALQFYHPHSFVDYHLHSMCNVSITTGLTLDVLASGTTNLVSVSIMLLFQGCYINGIILCAIFWFFPFNKILWRSIQAVVCVNSLFLLPRSVLHHVELFTCRRTSRGVLSCQPWGVNVQATFKCKSLCGAQFSFLWGKCPVELPICIVVVLQLVFHARGKLPKGNCQLFGREAVPFSVPTSSEWVSSFYIFSSIRVITMSFSCSGKCAVASHCGFNWHFSNLEWCRTLFPVLIGHLHVLVREVCSHLFPIFF